ncbi:uncharacterized protein [Apostichopus japonicus]|uniref:uncharacterized protein n=1 Tax=Stichopus japonicus TaxID=307972 RepID=UPI003AB84B46
MAAPYQVNFRLKACVRKFMALGFLPLLTVRQQYATLSTGRRAMALVAQYPALGQFIEYFEETYEHVPTIVLEHMHGQGQCRLEATTQWKRRRSPQKEEEVARLGKEN